MTRESKISKIPLYIVLNQQIALNVVSLITLIQLLILIYFRQLMMWAIMFQFKINQKEI